MHAVVFYSLIRKYDKLPIVEGDYQIYFDGKRFIFEYKNEILFKHVSVDYNREDGDISDIKTKKEIRQILTPIMRLSEVVACLDLTLKEDVINRFSNDYTPMYLERDGNKYKIYYFVSCYPGDEYFKVLDFLLTNDQIELFSKDQMAWYKYIVEKLI